MNAPAMSQTAPPPTVLVVEDEAHMRSFLRTTLLHNGYEVVEAATGASAVQALRAGGINLVLLDLGLPDVDGVEVASRVRQQGGIPVIVISARDREETKIEALDRGASDYVTKPFGAGELLARIRAALRATETRAVAPALFTVGDLKVSLARRQAWLAGEEVHLTPTEHDLLSVLVRSSGRVVSHRELLRAVWGSEAIEERQYLRVYMRQLRYKLEPEPAQPRYLITVPGVGYRMRVDG
ncbi:MAG TPA: response regulator transcription factor [Polyangiaceae bacterium]|nr:response regulator transcription factor [Polyangiaceae bacterium]